jgi:hypothetical protein
MITIDDVLSLADIDDNSLIRVENDERRFSTLNGQAEVLIQDKAIHMTNSSNGVVVYEHGVVTKGAQHLAETPSGIRINGFWVLNDDLLTTLPSTTYTPIPVLKYKASNYVKMIKGSIDFWST